MASLGGSSQRPAGTVVTQNVQEPWSEQQPHLKNIFGEAQSLYESPAPEYYPDSTVAPLSPTTQTALNLQEARALTGSDLIPNAQQLVNQTLTGGFLGANPYLQDMIDAASEGVTRNYERVTRPGIDSAFERAGRYGSDAYRSMHDDATYNLANTLANLSSNIAYTDYGRERGMMHDAIGMADPIAQADYSDIAQLARAGSLIDQQRQAELSADIDRFNFAQEKPFNKLANYLGMVGGGYGSTGTQTQPFFTNPAASFISGGLGGLGAAGRLGGNMGDFGTWALGGLGALGGLL